MPLSEERIPPPERGSPEDEKQPKRLWFPIVGVGASAGGLDAFTQFLSALPVSTGMAFVLIQHLDPTHESQLTGIMSRATAMPVLEARDDMDVRPNQVYVIPPNTTLTIAEGVLRLTPRRTDDTPHLPIDRFLESLAEEQGRLSIGVILSGNGFDGSQGIRAIKSQCGITFAQDETTARYTGMPRNAIATGVVDFVRPPAEMARELARISTHPYVVPPDPEQTGEILPDGDGELKKIFALLQRATKVDFSHYKLTTIRRRIGRRMIVHQSRTLGEYLHYLQRHPQELQELYRDILISVTRFFRDPEAFGALAPYLTAALRAKHADDTLRVWIAGCATGEEVYSLAICLLEIFQQEGIRPTLQLFGTDISEMALARARAGIYSEGIAQDVSTSRLGQFFSKVDSGYQIGKFIRDMCIFAKQDVTRDPPFSRVDLISCRNLLIYLGPALQKRVLPVFHYSLNAGGVLFLGPAETIGASADLFQILDAKHKIFTRKQAHSRLPLPDSIDRRPPEPPPAPRTLPTLDREDLRKKADHTIQSRYAPDGVVVNQNLQILQFRGRTGFYLESSRGQAGDNLLLMARESLQLPLRQAVMAAMAQSIPVQQKGVLVNYGGEEREINLEVMPMSGTYPHEQYYLIVFEPVTPAVPAAEGNTPATPVRQETLEEENARLKQDLMESREYLRAVREDYEASLEEQRASNEEISSANEELQSINEELGTTKEEFQSSNEELTTVNEELQNRNYELGVANDDLNNLLSAVNTPVLMVDRGLQLRRLTPGTEELLGISAADLGRSLAALTDRAKLPTIDHAVREVIDTLTARTQEMQDQGGCWWSLAIRPYRTSDHRILGAVLTFSDIDSLKRSLQGAEESRDYADAIVDTVREPLVVLGPDLHVERANAAFYETFQLTKESTDGRLLYQLDGGGWEIPQLRRLLEEVLPRDAFFEEFLIEHDFPGVGRRSISLNARSLLQEDHQGQRILLAVVDVTERLSAEQKLLRSHADLERFGSVVAHDLQEPLRTVASYTQLLGQRYQGQLDTDADEFIEFVNEGVSRMRAMIQDLLSYSQVGTAETAVERTSAEAALGEALWSLQAAMEESGAAVDHSPLPEVPYHSRQLVQVFQNLIGNALKYRRAEPPRIWISAALGPRECTFSVRDNGIGFEQNAAERIFQIFKRLHGREYTGTGIGLAICQRIVERHGGRIWAESVPGSGSVFHFTVPL